ncbi:MAG: YIP1 family protein [Candidatus Binataceae bacterium]
MSDVSPHGLSPFVSIFFRPRRTIRSIVDINPRMHVVPIALVAGGLAAIPSGLVASASSPVQMSGPSTLVYLTVLGALGGVVGLYISGWLLAFTGRQLGGTAAPLLVRASVGWSNVPSIAGSVATIVGLMTGAIAMPIYDPESPLRVSGALSGMNPLILGFATWSFIISLVCLSEVNGFSVLRALLAYFLIAVEIGILVLILVFVFVGVPGVGG